MTDFKLTIKKQVSDPQHCGLTTKDAQLAVLLIVYGEWSSTDESYNQVDIEL
jgi:hypothetical protein